MSLMKEDLVDLAIETTGMTRARWNLLSETLKDDAAMNRVMKEEWNAKPRDSEEAIREYYRESDIWFLNTFNHGFGALLLMAAGGQPGELAAWQKVFTKDLKAGGLILDYGGGFFNDTWPLVLLGFVVQVAEVQGPVTKFLRAYRDVAKLEDRFGVLGVGSDKPLHGVYQGVVCFETLEHVLFPVELAAHLYEHLVPGGPFAFSVSFGGPTHAPYHVASNAPLGEERVWFEKLQEIGFRPHWRDEQGQHLKIWRRP